MPPTTLLATCGLILSLYAVYVEYKMEHKDDELEEFTALCDIELIGASCSATFSLPEGRLVSYLGLLPKGHVLDVPNALLGAIFYILQILLPLVTGISNNNIIIKFLSFAGLCTSIFLAYKLTVLRELCILCWTTHVINACLFWNAISTNNKSSSGKKKAL